MTIEFRIRSVLTFDSGAMDAPNVDIEPMWVIESRRKAKGNRWARQHQDGKALLYPNESVARTAMLRLVSDLNARGEAGL